MREAVFFLCMIAMLLLGSVAGHYHGKATVYQGMFDHQAMLAEMINE
jgi:hypothetical protein